MKRFRSIKNNFAYVTSVFVTFSFATASVQVDFGHSYTSAPSANQNTGDITLDFTVDTEGNVTLDASSSLTPSSVYVDEFDGAVGNVSDPGIRGQSFLITR